MGRERESKVGGETEEEEEEREGVVSHLLSKCLQQLELRQTNSRVANPVRIDMVINYPTGFSITTAS